MSVNGSSFTEDISIASSPNWGSGFITVRIGWKIKFIKQEAAILLHKIFISRAI
jgi:hypothetical protein